MNTYSEYISEMTANTDGWWFLSMPIIGWIASVIVFGFYLPSRYFYDNGKYK